MRIEESEVKKEDIMWFAIDKNDIVAEFSSGSYGSIPEEVCESREDLDLICDYFIIDAEDITDSKTTNYGNKEGYALEFFKEYLNLSRKGIYGFNSYNTESEEDTEDYYKYTKPERNLLLSELPENISSVLKKCRLIDADFCNDNIIKVNGAYKERIKKRKKVEIASFVCAMLTVVLVSKDIIFPFNPILMAINNKLEILKSLITFLIALIGLVFGVIAMKKGSKRIITISGILINGIITVPILCFIAFYIL